MLPHERTRLCSVPVNPTFSNDLITAEIVNLMQSHMLLENEEYAVLQARAEMIPNMLYEIGRLRGIAFRKEGISSGRSIDLDRFDLFHLHIILWSKERNEVVGACRIGQIDIIMKRFGLDGLYINDIFKCSPSFYEAIGPSLELGRVFVRVESQKQYAPILLLLKGIARFVTQNPGYKTLLGMVSISSLYNTVPGRTVVSFLKEKGYGFVPTKTVRPKTPVCMRQAKAPATLTAAVQQDRDCDSSSPLISATGTGKKGIPPLLKHSVRAGVQILGFSLDAHFSNCVEGLFAMDLTHSNSRLWGRCTGGRMTARRAQVATNPVADDRAA